MTRDDIRNYIVDWNIRFPIDRWWRKKYNQSLNSIRHRESNFLDQLIEWEEDQLFIELDNRAEYKPGDSDWLIPQKFRTMEDDIQSLRDEFKDIE